MLAGEAGDEAAATNLATCLEPPVAHQQIAPGREPVGLASQQAPEHDTPALQQCLRDVLDRLVILTDCLQTSR